MRLLKLPAQPPHPSFPGTAFRDRGKAAAGSEAKVGRFASRTKPDAAAAVAPPHRLPSNSNEQLHSKETNWLSCHASQCPLCRGSSLPDTRIRSRAGSGRSDQGPAQTRQIDYPTSAAHCAASRRISVAAKFLPNILAVLISPGAKASPVDDFSAWAIRPDQEPRRLAASS